MSCACVFPFFVYLGLSYSVFFVVVVVLVVVALVNRLVSPPIIPEFLSVCAGSVVRGVSGNKTKKPKNE